MTQTRSSYSIRLRPERVREMRREVDRLGRAGFRKMGLPLVLEAIPALAREFKEVPGEFWASDVNDERYAVALVTCPCGDVHTVEVGDLHEASCGRFFYALGHTVLVAGTPDPTGP